MAKYFKTNDGKCWYGFEPKDKTGLIQITEQEWNAHLESLTPQQPTAEQLATQQKQKEMAEIKQWLNEHDYIINKHLLGEYTDNDDRWLSYLEERATKLARYNELEG